MPYGVYEHKRSDPVERFWAKVDKMGPLSPQDGSRCWLWTAAQGRDGYGSFNIGGGKTCLACLIFDTGYPSLSCDWDHLK